MISANSVSLIQDGRDIIVLPELDMVVLFNRESYSKANKCYRGKLKLISTLATSQPYSPSTRPKACCPAR